MKLNKKVVVAALALSLGFGAVAPTSQAFAADDANKVVDEDKYKEAGDAWLEAYKARKELTNKKSENETIKSTKAAELADKAIEINAKQLEIKNKKQELLDLVNEKLGEEITYEEIDEKIKDLDLSDEDKNEIDKLKTRISNGEYDLEELKEEEEQINQDLFEAEKILNGTTKVSYVGKDGEEKTDTLDKAIEELQAIEDEKKEAFIAEGGTEEEMEQILEADKVELPEDKTTIEDIRKLLNDVKVKRQALDYLQEFMPETVKRFQEEFDKAVKKADNTIEETEAWLEKNDPNYEK